MTNTTSGVTLFVPENPIIIPMSKLYDPSVTPPTGNVIPVVDTFVVDASFNVWIVSSVDPTTHASTLVPAKFLVSNTNPDDSLTSTVSYGNDIFWVYYDVRTSPIVVRPDEKLVVFGMDNVSYQLVQNPGPTQTVISRRYDASGNYTGQLVPTGTVVLPGGSPAPGASYFPACHVQSPLTDGEEIFIQVFNSQGAQTAQYVAFTKASIIINEAITPSPVITGVTITSPQTRSNGEIYIYQSQAIASLGLQVVMTYSDGHTRIVPIDQTQCFLYGTEDFIASYPGLVQPLIAKYYLNSSEVLAESLAALHRTYVTAETNLVVIANGLQTGVKISVVPQWNATTNQYNLSFFLYTTTRDRMINVTGMVTINTSTPFNGEYYGQPQTLTLQLDMSQAEPTIYSAPTLYQQTSIITLQALTATDRYTLADAVNGAVFGATTSSLARPVIHYDTTLQQYYIPSIYASLAAFLQAFFNNASPPYDTTNETQVPNPTHFWLRDPSSGVLLNSAAIPLAAWNAAFSIIGAGLANRYAGTGSNVIVEFVAILNSQTTLVLYGVPVDVYVGTYVSSGTTSVWDSSTWGDGSVFGQ